MQSLILISSLVLNSPVSISSLDASEQLEQLVASQTQAVKEQVKYQTKLSISDSDLIQARQVIRLAKQAGFSENEASE